MTPKEKAQELINSFSPHAKNWDCFYDIPLDENHAKKCALITVQEIISEMSDYYDEYDCTKTLKKIEYWQEVKQEIEKPMKPKEQAEQLLHEYRRLFMDEGEDYGQEILVTMLSLKCALISVNLILKDREEMDGMRVINDPYWLEVKLFG